MTIAISEQVGARLIEEARRQGISVETLVERLISERTESPTRSTSTELPTWRLGVIGSLRRRDIYDDVR
jgi:hypothetical protein